MKICSKCKIEKIKSEFHKDKLNKSGLQCWCKLCHKESEQSLKYKKTRKKYSQTPKCKLYIKNRQRKRKQRDINYKLRCNLGIRLYMALKNNQKVGSAVKDLGCSISELKEYLEKQFTEGMTWSNWGRGKNKWNIDHIKELHTFDLTNRQQFLEANHYTNLQPLWHEDHKIKTKRG